MEAKRESVSLARDKIYRLKGPAMMILTKGRIFALGRELTSREKVVVPRSRILCFKTLEDSEVEIVVGSEGSFEEASSEEEVIDIWNTEIDKILDSKVSSVLVLGPVDVGKTTFCCFMANKALAKNYSVYVIDADIGQADIGPPTTISAGRVDKPIFSLRELKPKYMAFIGVDSPMNVKERVIAGLKLIYEKVVKCEKPDIVIINTDGWTQGSKAHEYKLAIASVINPDAIVLLQKDTPELDNIIPVLRKMSKLFILPSPKAAKARDRYERKMFRESSYLRFINNLKLKAVSAEKCPLLYTHLFKGCPLNDDEKKALELHLGARVLYSEETCDRVIIIVDKPIPREKIEELRALYGKEVFIIVKGYEKGLLVGLLDKEMLCQGIGLLEEIDFDTKTLKIKTNVSSDPQYIAFGQVKLNEKGEEISKFRDWFL